jgi:hypothetical protein
MSQVTSKLAALCVPALSQQKQYFSSSVLTLAGSALNLWLTKALDTMRASPGSQAAAAVRQQLQDSGLMQHLGTGMNEAASCPRLESALAAMAVVPGCSCWAVACCCSQTCDCCTSCQQAQPRLGLQPRHTSLVVVWSGAKHSTPQPYTGGNYGNSAPPPVSAAVFPGSSSASPWEQQWAMVRLWALLSRQ